MGLVIYEESLLKGRGAVGSRSTVRTFRELTSKNREFLKSLGVTFHNHVGGGGKGAF